MAGLLNIVMEPFFKGELFDVSLVPVSISYERVLEETLYARELLGVPKPKESTSVGPGFAQSLMQPSISGRLRSVSPAGPVQSQKDPQRGLRQHPRVLRSARVRQEFSRGPSGPLPVQPAAQVPRPVPSSEPQQLLTSMTPSPLRHIPRRPGQDVQNFVNDSAYRLLRAQEENMVLKPWVLLASLLLQDHHQKLRGGQRPGLGLDQLTARAVWLRDVSRQYGAFLHWPGTARTSG